MENAEEELLQVQKELAEWQAHRVEVLQDLDDEARKDPAIKCLVKGADRMIKCCEKEIDLLSKKIKRNHTPAPVFQANPLLKLFSAHEADSITRPQDEQAV